MGEDAGDVRRAYMVCHDYAQSRTRGYGVGTQWIPQVKRQYCDALLAFVMHTDTLADDTTIPPERRAVQFRNWCDLFEAVQKEQIDRDDIEWSLCRAFVDTMTTWGLSQQSVAVYLQAQAKEVEFTHFDTYEELQVHADELIGTTCAWANTIYGGTTPEAERRARLLAMASQLSDYLVDLREDLTRGRLYLPFEDLVRFGVDRRTLERAALDGETPDQIRKLVLFEADRARGFCDAGSGWELLVDSSARNAAWLPGAVYRHQLDLIEQSGGDVFGIPPTRVEDLADRMYTGPISHTVAATMEQAPSTFDRDNPARHAANLPVHLGIILDGNRRWAHKHCLPTAFGHRKGGAVFRDLSIELFARGIRYVSAYVFSTENWTRDPQEVGEIMELLAEFSSDVAEILNTKNIRIRFIGRPEELPHRLRNAISQTERLTVDNDGGTLAICINYGGQMEIVDAFREMLAAGVSTHDVSTRTVADYLYAPDIPPVDLVLRTGGEQRLSNFMLWRAAYAEFVFVSKLWPEITIEDIENVLEEYAARVRRLGS
jgi:undecaprenyl diphosphate synthase